MMWNSGLGVKPKLTFSANCSELHSNSVSKMKTSSGAAGNGEQADNGDIKMMIHYGNSRAAVVEEELQRQQRASLSIFLIFNSNW